MKKLALSVGLLVLAVGALPSSASAAPLTCSTTTTTGDPFVSGTTTTLNAASQCEYLDPPSSGTVANETNVNAAGFFGSTTWTEVQKTDLADNAGQSGTWSISASTLLAYPFLTNNYMITFKDGDDTNLISFLLNELYSSGGWISPFRDPPFTDLDSTIKNVSHFTIFRTHGGGGGSGGENPPIPEPASLILLGSGLSAIAYRVRRRKTS